MASIARVQLEAVLDAGVTVDAYVYLYWRRDVRAEVARALETIEGLRVGRLWLDCEDDSSGIEPGVIVERIDTAIEACALIPAGIYTGHWWWAPATADSRRFSDLPLWHAQYTRSADEMPAFDAFTAYGGWTRPLMWQFRGTTQLCGVSVDLNLREVNADQTPNIDLDRIDLALLRAGQRFDRARALGRYVFRPAPDPAMVELQRVEDGHGVSFDPPYLLPVN